MLITAVWIVCGLAAYGLMKGSIMNRPAKFTDDDEMTCATAFALGPISLFAMAIGVMHAELAGYQYKLSFRFRIPKKRLK